MVGRHAMGGEGASQCCPTTKAPFERPYCSDRAKAEECRLLFSQLFANGRGGIANLIDNALELFPGDAEVMRPILHLVIFMHVDVAAVLRTLLGQIVGHGTPLALCVITDKLAGKREFHSGLGAWTAVF